MHWVSILYALLLTVLSAGLVFLADWSVSQAFITVAVGGVAFVFVLLGILLVLASPEARRPLFDEVWQTFWQDVRDFRDWITGRRKS